MTQNTTQKWVENKHMMINHNNKDKTQKQQGTTHSTRKRHKKITHFLNHEKTSLGQNIGKMVL